MLLTTFLKAYLNQRNSQPMKLKLIALLAVIIFFNSCKNDLDLNAPYKEIAVVYGFLDQSEPVQVFRIERAFQNASGTTVLEGAQKADSLYFDTLYVTVKNVNTNMVYTCNSVDTIGKDSGYFGTSKSKHYVTKIPSSNDPNHTWELNIYNPKSGKSYSASTKLVQPATIEPRIVYLSLLTNNYFAFRFKPGQNSVLHDLIIRFNYTEAPISNPMSIKKKFVDFIVRKNAEFANNTSINNIPVQSVAFINQLKANIVRDDALQRKITGIEFQAYGGGNDFKVLLDLSKPNTSIVQKQPVYTNISDGLGIFTSRNLTKVSAPDVKLDDTAIDLLITQLPNFIK